MNADDIRRWASDHRAAAARERAWTRRHRLSAPEAFQAALALLAYDESLNGSPFTRPDPVSAREDAQMRQAWTTLRARWTGGR